MKKIIVFSFITFLLGFPFFTKKVFSADFINQVNIVYSVDSDGTMHITETKSITNNSSKYYITEESFFISPFKTRTETTSSDLGKIADTVTLTDSNGNKISHEIKIHDENIEVIVPIGDNFSKGDTKNLILKYENFELAAKSGNVWNIYIPALPKNFDQTVTWDIGATSRTHYSVSLEVDSDLGEPNFVLPEPTSSVTVNNQTVYQFDANSLAQNYAWIQFGNKQYYSFEIRQPVKSSSNLGVFNVLYDLVLPRNSENQTVYFESIQPEPEYIREDDEGNIISRFKFTNQQETEIIVKGYIESKISQKISRDEVGNIEDYDYSKMYADMDNYRINYADLLKPTQYWEVDSDKIRQKAKDLKGNDNNVYDILISDYKFIIENVDYDNLKTGIKNQRQGALKTLEGGASVCMEYSDLLITLLRAQGIPARAAFGYGFDPKSDSLSTQGHQWVEVFMPNVGWVAVDPTWGDTGRKEYIGGDVDHALWRVASVNVDTPSPVTKYSVMDESVLEPPSFTFDVVSQLNKSQYTDLDGILNKYPYTKKHTILEKVNQLNDYGKVVFIGLPAVLLLLIIIFSFITLIKLFKEVFGKNFVHAKPASHDAPPDNPYYQ